MPSVTEHYANHLAPIYTWMAGGVEAALLAGASDIADVIPSGNLAVDLGAGFGMHSIPLAQAGYRVVAIDSCAALLDQLSALAKGLAIEAHCDDLMRFAEYLAPDERPDLVLCMGDTLTHCEHKDHVFQLVQMVASRLATGGRFVATFRDYSRLPAGEARFIPVKSDEHRILTCFLEELPKHVQVHDLVHEHVQGEWVTKVSSYRKLRLEPEEVRRRFEDEGLRSQLGPGPRGMVRLIAEA